MRSKNSAPIKPAESDHMGWVKSLPCAVCERPGPSEAHHIEQGQHFTTISLCPDCHRGSINGWHGQKAMWRIHKMDELRALNKTLGRLYDR